MEGVILNSLIIIAMGVLEAHFHLPDGRTIVVGELDELVESSTVSELTGRHTTHLRVVFSPLCHRRLCAASKRILCG